MMEELVKYVSASLVSFVFGLIVGFYGRGYFGKLENKKNKSASTFVLLVVTSVWAVSVFVDILSPTYETSPLIHGLMGAIVGFFYKPFVGGIK